MAHPESKWLLISLSGLWATGIHYELEDLLAQRPLLMGFATKIDMNHFDEIWIVWEVGRRSAGQATSVIILAKDQSPRHFIVSDDHIFRSFGASCS